MKTIVGIAVLLAALCSTALAAGYKNEPNGFRGIEWGKALASRNDMQRLARDKNGNVYYKRRGDKLQIGAATLDMIWYREHRHQLESVYVESKGASNQSALLAALEHRFGAGAKLAESEEKYLWDGPKTRVFLKCNAVHTCELIFLSKQMMEEENKE